jgi:hypothetical protein
MGLRTLGIAMSTVLAIAGLTRGQRGTWSLVTRSRQWGDIEPEPELERPDNPPEWALDPDIWEHARDTVAPHWSNYEEPWAVVTHIYERMGGRVA